MVENWLGGIEWKRTWCQSLLEKPTTAYRGVGYWYTEVWFSPYLGRRPQGCRLGRRRNWGLESHSYLPYSFFKAIALLIKSMTTCFRKTFFMSLNFHWTGGARTKYRRGRRQGKLNEVRAQLGRHTCSQVEVERKGCQRASNRWWVHYTWPFLSYLTF